MRERDRSCGDHPYVLGFSILVLILSLRKVWGFLLYGFPKKNPLCLLSLVLCLCFIVLHVILSLTDPKIIMVAYMIKKLTSGRSVSPVNSMPM